MGISQGSVRVGAKAVAQNTPTTGSLGVNLLLTDPDDFNAAIRQALKVFESDRPNQRVVDSVLAASGFRVVLKGDGALAELVDADAWPGLNLPVAVFYPWDVTSQGQEPMDPNWYRITKDPGSKTILEFTGDTLTAGDTLRLVFNRPHQLSEAPAAVVNPAAAPTVALASPAVAGNVDNGTHTYVFTWTTADGETAASPASDVVTVADKTVNGKVTVTVPASDDYGVTGAKVYRTIAGNTGSKKLVGSLATNGGTFTDNVADADLGAAAPAANDAGGTNTVDDEDEELLTTLVASFILQMAANKAAQNTGNTNLPNDVVDRRSQSDVYRSRAKELRAEYDALVGRGGSDTVAGHSAFGDLDTAFSDGRGFLWHGGR